MTVRDSGCRLAVIFASSDGRLRGGAVDTEDGAANGEENSKGNNGHRGMAVQLDDRRHDNSTSRKILSHRGGAAVWQMPFGQVNSLSEAFGQGAKYVSPESHYAGKLVPPGRLFLASILFHIFDVAEQCAPVVEAVARRNIVA